MQDDKTARDAMGDLYDSLTSKDDKTDDPISETAEITEDSQPADAIETSPDDDQSGESTETAENPVETKQEDSEKSEVAENPEKIEAKESEQVEETPKEVNPDAARPPNTWSATAKSKWAELDPVAQAEIIKREADATKGIQQYRDQAEYGKKIKDLINPYTPTLKAQGVAPETVIETLLNTYYQLTTGDPATKGRLLMETAQRFGADMTGLNKQPDEVDQRINPLLQEINTLKQQSAREKQQAIEQENQAMEAAINTFSAEVDDSGQLKHPYLSNVMEDMVDLMPSIGRKNPGLTYQEILNQSYDRAIWNNPETRALVQSQQAAQTDAQRQQEANERAARADKANSVNISTEGVHDSAQQKPLGSIRDTMDSTYDAIISRT